MDVCCSSMQLEDEMGEWYDESSGCGGRYICVETVD